VRRRSIAVLAGGLITAYLFLSVWAGSFNPAQWFIYAPAATSSVGFNLRVRGFDSQNIYSSLKEGENYTCLWAVKRGSGWLILGKGDTSVEVSGEDEAYVYALIKGSPSYYVDVEATKTNNPKVFESVLYGDLIGDRVNEYAFRLNLTGLTKPASGNTTFYFYPYFLSYQKPRINSPGDVNGTGTKYIEWKLSLDAEKAFAITKVEFQVNTVDASKIKLVRLNVPGVGYLDLGSPSNSSNALTWTYTAGEDPFKVIYVKNGDNTTRNYSFTVMVESQLSLYTVKATLTVYIADPSFSEEETITSSVNFLPS